MAFAIFIHSLNFDREIFDRLEIEDLRIVLVQDGVYHATIEDSPVFKKKAKVYILEEDMVARGIKKEDIKKDVEIVNYSKLVDLIMQEFDKVVWY